MANTNEAVVAAAAAVDALYSLRDHFFEGRDVSQASKKSSIIAAELKKVLDTVNPLVEANRSSPLLSYQRGRALNVLPTYDQEAEDALSRSVKLDPKFVDAWNALGECFWKKRDLDGAKNCFTGALNQSNNKVSLRNLSMVYRQLGASEEERLKNIAESVALAKKAVALDVRDGTSWYVLGNAHLSLFFSGAQDTMDLKSAISAYKQAENDPASKSNPDLHYNRAVVMKYLEDFKGALEGFALAAAFDPAWNEPIVQAQHIHDYLAKIADLVEKRGRIKNKKLSALSKTVQAALDQAGKTRPQLTFPSSHLRALAEGKNGGKSVLLHVVAAVPKDDPIPQVFLAVDSEQQFVAITIYNMGSGVLKASDLLEIPEPLARYVLLTQKEKTYRYLSIRVENPAHLRVNGSQLDTSAVARSVLAVVNKSD